LLLLIPSPSEEEPQTNTNDSDDSKGDADNNTSKRTFAYTPAASSAAIIDDLSVCTIRVAILW
jgi:hypothetical protein